MEPITAKSLGEMRCSSRTGSLHDDCTILSSHLRRAVPWHRVVLVVINGRYIVLPHTAITNSTLSKMNQIRTAVGVSEMAHIFAWVSGLANQHHIQEGKTD